jgi:hypothetical protein
MMKFLFFLFGIASFAIAAVLITGVIGSSSGGTSVHTAAIEALLLFVISAVFLVGAGIIEALQKR